MRADDFDDFDLIVAMDRANADDLRQIAPSAAARAKIRLLREFDPAGAGVGAGAGDGGLDVPDPYYGEGDGFERVLDYVQAACAGLLARIRAGEIS